MYYCSTCKQQVALILSQSWISVHGQELTFLQVCLNSITFLLVNIPYFTLSAIEILQLQQWGPRLVLILKQDFTVIEFWFINF